MMEAAVGSRNLIEAGRGVARGTHGSEECIKVCCRTALSPSSFFITPAFGPVCGAIAKATDAPTWFGENRHPVVFFYQAALRV